MMIPRSHLLLDGPLILNENEVHLWRFDLEKPPTNWQEIGKHLLSNDENERAAKFKRGMDDYINTRIFMRKVLAKYTDKEPQNLTFDHNPYGKPFLRQSDIQFNLSHSKQWAVLAVGLNCDLGIDVESTSDRRSILSIAQNYFHPNEIAHLEKITDEEKQQNYFFQLWTLKESFVKGLGTGISTGLDKMNFSIDINQKINASFSEDLQLKDSQDWKFFQYELHDASIKNWCALAVKSPHEIQTKWM
jgi:4'-phosphopantetheinyl transferase